MNNIIRNLNTPSDFFKSIPQNPAENLQWRMDFHDNLSKDKGLQKAYLELCWADIKIIFNSAFFVYDAEAPSGFRNRPFILWPHQETAVDAIHDAITNEHDLVIDKSRKEGATEIICKTFVAHFLLDPESQFLVGSRKAEFVDKGVEIFDGNLVGLHKSLMHKICYAINTLPHWMRPNVLKTYMLLQNLDSNSVISGEATNENFGAGDRQCGILIDEYGRMDHNMAININDSVHDVTNCVIFNSTHFWGVEHPYNQLLLQKFGTIPVVTMPWEMNPTKNAGLYLSPDYDIIEIKDIDYYRKLCPEIFNDIDPMTPIKLSVLEKEQICGPWAEILKDISFVADGGDSNEGGWRSAWYDKKCKERRPSDIARNLDRRPKGSGYSVFSQATLHRIEQKHISEPIFKGDVVAEKDKEGIVRKGKLISGSIKRLFWWDELIKGRPSQEYNYIVGCDIGLGRGVSNSVASIVNTNTCEEVGKWICPNTPPESFADAVIALCKWIGGKDKEPYLIWESNGPGGIFETVIVKNNYPFVYIRRDEAARRKKKKNRLGWASTQGPDGTKYRLLMDLDVALKEGLSEKPTSKHLRIYDVNVIREMETYVFNSAGTPHPSVSINDEDSSASAAHGDRVIALGLCCLGLTYQPKALIEKRSPFVGNSLASRIEKRKIDHEKELLNKRFDY